MIVIKDMDMPIHCFLYNTEKDAQWFKQVDEEQAESEEQMTIVKRR